MSVKNRIYFEILKKITDEKSDNEEREGKLFGFGFGFGFSSVKAKIPQEFLQTYSNAKIKIISPENYLEFLKIVSKQNKDVVNL